MGIVQTSVRNGLTIALLLLLLGVVQGCSGEMIAPDLSEDPKCVWIDGVLYCTD